MSNKDMLDRADNIEIGLSFNGKMSREQVLAGLARLLDAQKRVLAAAPFLMSDECKFHGDEILGKLRMKINEEDWGV